MQHYSFGSDKYIEIKMCDLEPFSKIRSHILCHLEFVVNESSETVTCSEHTTNNTNETHCNCEVFIGLAVVFIVTSVIATTIIIILSWKLCSQKRNNGNLRTYSIQFDVAMCLINCHSIDVVTIPPVHLQRQLNVDNIQMQISPAYVSIDKKSPRLYQNI